MRTKSAPVLGGIDAKTLDEETTLVFTASVTDLDGDPSVFSLGTAPAGASITADGTFTWTPTEDQGPGSYQVTIVVSDGLLTDSKTFTITVREVNRPPVLEFIRDKSIIKGATLTFSATASDPDIPGQNLRFSVERAAAGAFPDGASITIDGVFSWTPRLNQGPGTYTVRIIVSDGQAMDVEQIAITVAERESVAPQAAWLSWLPWIGLSLAALLSSSLALWIRSKKTQRA